MPQIIPIKDLKNTSEISDMCKKTKEPIYITKNGYGDMVIMSMKTYDEYMLRQEIYQKLSAAEEDFHSGDVTDAEESLQNFLESGACQDMGSSAIFAPCACITVNAGKTRGTGAEEQRICLFPYSSAIMIQALLEGGSFWRLHIY